MTRTIAIIGTRGYPSFYGGFETAVRKIAPFLSDRGWSVRVYSRPGETKPDSPDIDPRVEVVFTRGLSGKSVSTLTFGLTSVLHALFHKPDVALVMNCANGFWLPLLRLRRIPVVTNVDGIEWERDKWGPLAKRVFWLGAWFTARFSNDLVFDAHAIADYWREHFGREGHFIPYGGDTSPPLPLQDDLAPQGYVLLVARFVPENTVREFLAATPSITKDLDVVLVGTSGSGGELDAMAQTLAEENPRVHWLRHISDDERLFALWQHAAVYFHGHSVGGTNPALVQAMALGANIVARDTVYNREVLGADGVFCKPSPRAIFEAVLTADQSHTRGERLKRRAQDLYSWNLVCHEYEAVAEHWQLRA